MKVYLYSGMQKLIEKSGVGRAIYHERCAAEQNGIGLAQGLFDADIVHINTVFFGSLLLAYRAGKKGIPIVFHAHSTKEDFRNSYLGSNLFDGIFARWIIFCYGMGDVIVTPTVYSKKLLESYGIQKEIEVVSNGIDLFYYDREKADSMKFRKKYGYGEAEKIIMSVGLTIGRKGVLDFVRLAEHMPQYQFIWFGETNLRTVPAAIRKAVKKELPNLKFAGYANKEELREAYRGCDLFLFPSWEETEGIVVLEALAMKVPILLRDIPVYEDWLVAEEEVYKAKNLEEFEEKAEKILEGRLPSLTEKAYKKAEERSLKKTGKKLEKIYRRCLLNDKTIYEWNLHGTRG